MNIKLPDNIKKLYYLKGNISNKIIKNVDEMILSSSRLELPFIKNIHTVIIQVSSCSSYYSGLDYVTKRIESVRKLTILSLYNSGFFYDSDMSKLENLTQLTILTSCGKVILPKNVKTLLLKKNIVDYITNTDNITKLAFYDVIGCVPKSVESLFSFQSEIPKENIYSNIENEIRDTKIEFMFIDTPSYFRTAPKHLNHIYLNKNNMKYFPSFPPNIKVSLISDEDRKYFLSLFN